MSTQKSCNVGGTKFPIPDLKDEEMNHVFISYSSENENVAHAMVLRLKSLGFKCFWSAQDFTPGVSVVANILQGIEKSRRVLILVSKQFLKSDWFIFETQQTLAKTYESNMRVMIPVLYDVTASEVPTHIKEFNYLEFRNEAFWEKLKKSTKEKVQYTEDEEEDFWKKLLRSLTDNVPMTSAIPAGNVAHGLAWSYFYGYLNLVLPGLPQRVVEHQQKYPGIQPFLPKMLILLPESCYCPGNIHDADENFVAVKAEEKDDPKDKWTRSHIPFNATRAGNINRDYKSSVYKVTDPNTKQVYYCCAELATPLLSLFEMTEGTIAGLNKEQKFHQMKLFVDKLREILEHPNNAKCHNTYVMVTYKDRIDGEEGKADRLSEIVARKIEHEFNKESHNLANLSIE